MPIKTVLMSKPRFANTELTKGGLEAWALRVQGDNDRSWAGGYRECERVEEFLLDAFC